MKFNLNNVKTVATRVVGRSGLFVKKHSPEILLTAGIVGVVASTVMCCKATLKVDELLDARKEQLDNIHYAKDTLEEEEYSEQDYKKDLTITYVQTGLGFVKLYGPAVSLGILSVGCILGAHGIMKKRNVALMAAYKTIEQSFNDYRQRVVEELGEEKDKMFKYGIRQETVTEVEKDANGKEKKVTKTVNTLDPNTHSQYARFFDEASPHWSKTPEYNLIFLKAQQNYANDLLHARGHLFLNEVYDMLGIPRSQAGAVVGWVMSEHGDNFVDFGMYQLNNMKARDFVNGYERSILIDPNVDGVIYDLL